MHTILKLRFWLMVVWALTTSYHLSGQAETAYVGSGRYACHSDSARCARVKQHNTSQERQKRAESREREERANRYVRDSKERQERLNRSVEAERPTRK